MVRLAVHVVPKAGRDEFAGWRGDALQVRVTAAPEGGRANTAVCRLVADALGVAKSRVKVALGHSSRHKVLELDEVTTEDLRAAFGEPDQPLS